MKQMLQFYWVDLKDLWHKIIMYYISLWPLYQKSKRAKQCYWMFDDKEEHGTAVQFLI